MLILFTVLRVLGLALKSPNSTLSSDSEKGQSKRGPSSRPTYIWDPQYTFAPPSQPQMMRTAPPAHPPSTILQGSAPRPLFLAGSLFQPGKKAGSTYSSTRPLTSESLSRSSSPSVSLNGSEISVTTTIVEKPMVPASLLDAELSLPPLAMQRHPESGPLQLLTADSPQNGLTHYSPPRHSRISNAIPRSPSIPQSTTPFQEVTLHSPAVNNPPTSEGGISSLVNLYFSRKPTESFDRSPRPAPAVSHDSPVVLPPTSYVSAGRSVSAALSVGAQVVTHHEGVISPPEPALSLGAVRDGYGPRQFSSSAVNPDSPPAPVVSPVNSIDPSQYSGTEAGSPPPPPLPVLRPTQPLRFSKVAMTPSEHRLLDPLRTSLDRPVLRALPLPPTVAGGRGSPSVYSQGSSTVWTHIRQGSSSSYLSRYR